MNIWVLLAEWKTCSFVVALTASERRSFTSPTRTPRRGWDFLTRAVKHLWLPPLSGCLSLIPPAANCLYWSSSCLRLLYRLWDNGAERSWNTGQRALYVLYLHSGKCHVRSVTTEKTISNHLFCLTVHISMSLPNYQPLKGLFMFASRCICVAWVNSLLHLCHRDFYCKREMSGRKEQIVAVWKCVCTC